MPPKERNKAVKVVEAIKAGYICDLEGNLLSCVLSYLFYLMLGLTHCILLFYVLSCLVLLDFSLFDLLMSFLLMSLRCQAISCTI